ncbi:hypothetical protein YPPY92_4068, partial [Yersinia pestis PY-92]
MGIRRGSL